jgi:hypothetical protein
MAKVNAGKVGRPRVVWRVTSNAPLGEYVDPDKIPEPEPPGRVEAQEPGWLLSSFELSHGLQVTDESDTIPAELFDSLFKR